MELSGELHAPAPLSSVKAPQYLLDMGLDAPQRQSGCNGEQKNLYTCRKYNPSHPASRQSLY